MELKPDTAGEWRTVKLGDVAILDAGVNKDISRMGYGCLYVTVGDLYAGSKISTKSLGRIDVSEEEIERFRLVAGDIVFNKSSVKRDGIAYPNIFHNADEDVVFTGFAIRARCKLDVANSAFVLHALRSSQCRRWVINNSQSSALTNLNGRIARLLPFSLPVALKEQDAIAGVLSDMDALIESLEKLIAKKRDMKLGAMQMLLSGTTRLPGFTGAWRDGAVDDVAEINPESLGAGTLPGYEFKYISLEDVKNGSLNGWQNVTYKSAPSRARQKLKSGDVLMANVRPNLLGHLFHLSTDNNWVGSTGFSIIRCNVEKCDAAFLSQLIFSIIITRQIDVLTTGSNYPAISSSDVRRLRIPLPPLKEQQAIAGVLSGMDAEIDALEMRLAKTQDIKIGMAQLLLTGKTRLI